MSNKHSKSFYIVTSPGFSRARQTISQISPSLVSNGSLIDIGTGSGHVSSLLSKEGYDVTSIDVRDVSTLKNVHVIPYDGKHIPFEEKKFDTALLLTVLHHTNDPIGLLKEASRVSKSVIIIEDVYTTKIGKVLTHFIDSLLNWEWRSHPHSNKTEKEWISAFAENNFEIVRIEHWFSLILGIWPIRQVLFTIQEKK